jgi:hypothetical protein
LRLEKRPDGFQASRGVGFGRRPFHVILANETIPTTMDR